ncbi:MAG: DUF1080 domain-containing protein [Bryobacteraceae bacterium]
MRAFLILFFALCAWAAPIPKGFRPLFNGKDLKGWHISEVNHHGNTKAWAVKDGIVTVTQNPPGNGGILLTDKTYKNFEISLEVNPDFGCDGGLFLRSTEKGEAYQVMLDFLEGGNMGGIYGEGLPELNKPDTGSGKKMDPEWQKHWKKGTWNHIRARIEGDAPHIQVWLNGTQVADWTAAKSFLPGGGNSGMIALQAHRSDPKGKNPRWLREGGFHRFRNVAIKELP